MAFRYDSAKQQVEDSKHIAQDRHNCTITRTNAMLSKNQDPMLIVNFKIRDDNDPDDGKELPGFLTFAASDMQIQSIEQFCAALDKDPEVEFAGIEIDVPWLKDWGNSLIGEMLSVESKNGTGEYAGKPIARNYYLYGNLAAVDELDDLDLVG